MPFTSYENFDLLIGRGPSGYRADVVHSLAGEPSTDFDLPFPEGELASVLCSAVRSRRDLFDAETAQAPANAIDFRSFGERLYRAVFTAAVETALLRSLDEAAHRKCGLRIRLQIADSAAGLANLPWEYLFAPHRNRFLALSDQSPFVRYLRLSHGEDVQSLQITPPLLILTAVANPSEVTPLAVDQEWARLQQAVAGLADRGLIRLERLPAATLLALQDRLSDAQQGAVHIFHFIGHGFFDAAEGRSGLVFEQEDGSVDLTFGDRLGTILCDHRSLRLAFLNSCQGARGGRGSVFGGVAQHLVQQGIPAVVAMQFPVGDAAAIALAAKFYQRLAEGDPVDTALTEARKAIVAANDSMEWGAPVLFSRSPDNRILVRSDTTVVDAEASHVCAPGATKIATRGGAFVGGDVNTQGGDWIGRDKITINVGISEEAVMLSGRLRGRAELREANLRVKSFEPETILIPGGPFLMGTAPDTDVPQEEVPMHEVILDDYRIGKCPVTNAQFKIFLDDQKRLARPEMRWHGQFPPAKKENHPISGVTWYDALDYCEWLSKRTKRHYALPNEAQWEKAARSSDGRVYPWGNDWDPRRCHHGRPDTAAVDAYPPQSEYGCYDMVGNVREWTCSLWGDRALAPDENYRYPWREDQRNDPSANGQIRRIYRGGAASDEQGQLRCASRGSCDPMQAGPYGKRHGFRVVLVLETED